MTSLSDPARPSRGDRRRIQQLVDGAYASGRLSAAERAMRTQRVQAAQTRGELAMVARDLGAPDPVSEGTPEQSAVSQPTRPPAPAQPAQPSLGSAIDPAVLRAMKVGGNYRGGGTSNATGSTPTIDLSGLRNVARTVRIVVLVSAAGFLLLCGIGIVPAFIEGFRSGWSGETTETPAKDVSAGPSGGPVDGAVRPSAAASLHTAAGWTALVDAIEERSGKTSVYDLVVYPTYAAVGLDAGTEVDRAFYRDGRWQASIDVQTPIVGQPVDVRTIDPKTIEQLVTESPQRLGVEEPTGTYLIVNAIPSDPKIMVYVQSDNSSKYQAYSLDGAPRGF